MPHKQFSKLIFPYSSDTVAVKLVPTIKGGWTFQHFYCEALEYFMPLRYTKSCQEKYASPLLERESLAVYINNIQDTTLVLQKYSMRAWYYYQWWFDVHSLSSSDPTECSLPWPFSQCWPRFVCSDNMHLKTYDNGLNVGNLELWYYMLQKPVILGLLMMPRNATKVCYHYNRWVIFKKNFVCLLALQHTNKGCNSLQTNQITRTLQIFVNKCLRWIMNIKWTDKITNEELWRITHQKSIENQIQRRKWNWIGHTLHKETGAIENTALDWNP